MDDLPDLNNVYDTITTNDFLQIAEKEDLQEFLLSQIYEFMTSQPHSIAEENFYSLLQEYLEEEISLLIENFPINEVLLEEIEQLVEDCIGIYFTTIEPPRSYPTSEIIKSFNNNIIQKQLSYLRSLPQPVQRTPEWYTFRHNLITASNAYKAFENECSRNQLIFEKCKPLVIEDNSVQKFVNTESTLHWGQKYEPLSVLFYEHMYNTKIEDFGCIQHKQYTFLGASPDGINVDENNPRFGRMLEIKNIVNREITGIPKKEYWIQMQLQMEVWELDECDFLETKFDEFESSQQYEEDTTSILKGVILYFNSKTGVPHYIYKPFDIKDSNQLDEWQEQQINEMEKKDCIWIRNIYWKLSQYSCVLVPRNKQWFMRNVPQLIDTWNTILQERESGYEHRQAKKRTKTNPESDTQPEVTMNMGSGCLLNLDKETNSISLK